MIKVQDIMNTEVITVTTHAHSFQAAEAMRENKIRHLPVMDDRALKGIVSDRDLKEAVTVVRIEDPQGSHWSFREPHEIGDIMTKDVVTVSPEDDIHKAARLMVERKIGALPVTESGTPESPVVGIVTESDLLHVLVQYIDEIQGIEPKPGMATS